MTTPYELPVVSMIDSPSQDSPVSPQREESEGRTQGGARPSFESIEIPSQIRTDEEIAQQKAELDAAFDRLSDTANARIREYQQMLSALEAVEQWFYDSNVPTGARERELLEIVRAAIKAGRA